MNRRGFLQGLLGAGALAITAPYVKFIPKTLPPLPPVVVPPPVIPPGVLDKLVCLPIRAVYPKFSINEFMSVQPMTGPTSQIFYLDYLNPRGIKPPWWKFWRSAA